MQRRHWLTIAIAVVLLSTAVPLTAGADNSSTDTIGNLSVNSTTEDAKPGDRIPVTVSLNHTSANRTAYIIDVKEPAGFEVKNVSADYYQSAGTKWLLPTVRPDSSREMTFVVHVPSNATGSYELPLVAKTDEGIQDRTTITIDTPGERTSSANQTGGSTPTSSSTGPGFGIVIAITSLICVSYTLTRQTG